MLNSGIPLVPTSTIICPSDSNLGSHALPVLFMFELTTIPPGPVLSMDVFGATIYFG